MDPQRSWNSELDKGFNEETQSDRQIYRAQRNLDMLESVYSRHNELVERSQAQSQISHYSVDTVLEERLIEELEYDIENVHRELENMQCMTMNSLHNQSLNYHYGHI